MVWWVVMLIMLGFQVVSNLLVKAPTAKPEDVPRLPRNDGSVPIPVAFGECLITGPQLIDYFDFKAVPMKRRNPGTLFLTTITTGYNYYLGMVFGVCWGKGEHTIETEGARLIQILIDNRVVWEGGGGSILGPYTPNVVNYPAFWGSPEQQGGLRFQGAWYGGADLTDLGFPPTSNPYWAAQRGMDMPHYKDLAYFVFYGPSAGANIPDPFAPQDGWIGNTTNLWPIAFRLLRRPLWVSNGTVADCGDTPSSNGAHANPIECLVELLCDPDYGAGIPLEALNTTFGTIGGFGTFSGAAWQVWSEGLGFSYLWTRSSPVEEMVAEILRYVNGVLWTDLQTGKINIFLVREAPDLSLLPSFSNDDFLEIESFTRGSWEDTKNEIRVTFTNHDVVGFEEDTAFHSELANRQIQGVTDAVEIQYRGCPSMRLANRLAAREARVLATPLARMTARIDRSLWNGYPGMLFKFSWPEQGISNLVMRITNIKLGNLLDGRITITAAEDVFAVGRETYGNPAGTVWTDPLDGAAEDALGAAGELPYWYQRDAVPRAFGVARRPSAKHIAYTGALNGANDAPDSDFTPTGTLQAGYPQLSTTDFDTSGTLVIEDVADADEIAAGSAADIATLGASLALLGDPAGVHEWIAFEGVSVSGSTVTLTNVWRGLLDTPPRAHSAGERVWFFSAGAALFTTPLADGATAVFKALTRTPRDQLAASSATSHSLTVRSRALRPLPPSYLLLNGDYDNEIYSGSGDLVFTWREHSRLTAGIFKQSATTESPEGGVTYEVDVVGEDGSTVGRTVTGLSSPTWTYTPTDFAADFGVDPQTPVFFRFYASRDGLRSLYPYEKQVFDLGGGSVGSMAEDADPMLEDISVMIEV